jgi:hypothetical protein
MGWFRSTRGDGDGAAPAYEERLALIRPGVPGRCPSCDGLGYIDSIDIGHRYQIQHCKDCLHRWEYLFDGDGIVVGLTELDDAGRPVGRSRVRPLRAAPAETDDDEPDVVLDLRDGTLDEPEEPVEEVEEVAPVVSGDATTEVSEVTELSPAEWLRRSLHR